MCWYERWIGSPNICRLSSRFFCENKRQILGGGEGMPLVRTGGISDRLARLHLRHCSGGRWRYNRHYALENEQCNGREAALCV